MLGFISIADLYDERYVTLVDASRHEVAVKLFCLDPSHLLAECLQRGISALMFSATLTPLPYFRDMLGGGEGDSLLALDSPFNPNNLCLLVADRVSTRFRDRDRSREEIAGLIASLASAQTGNYMVYFPSYKYMRDVYEVFISRFPDVETVVQESDMAESERRNSGRLRSAAPANLDCLLRVGGNIRRRHRSGGQPLDWGGGGQCGFASIEHSAGYHHGVFPAKAWSGI